nr:hypothetical protein [Anaerolineaceae bacterium]
SLFAPESEIAFAIENSFSISEYLHLGGSSISARFSKMDDTTMRIDYYCINSSFFESTNRKFRLLSIPSEDHNKQLVIVQPFNKYDAMNMLSGLSIEDIESERGEGYQENTYCIPQGKYFSEYDFTDPLIEYGIRRIFFPDVAELTNLTNSQSAFISGIYSFTKSNFEVLGEPAAYSSLPEETLWLDSPFLYFEIDNEDSLLLGIGRLISP